MYMMSFFFSSRRRHTRCSRDWSSDVCSSDLDEAEEPGKDYERDGGVAKLAPKRDALDDLLEEALSIAQQRLEEIGVARDRLVSSHGRGPTAGVRPKLSFYYCYVKFSDVI